MVYGREFEVINIYGAKPRSEERERAQPGAGSAAARRPRRRRASRSFGGNPWLLSRRFPGLKRRQTAGRARSATTTSADQRPDLSGLRRAPCYVSTTTMRSSEARSFLTAMTAVGKASPARGATAAP